MQAWLGATNFQSSVNFANVFYYTYMGNEHATVRVRLGRSKIFCSFLFFVLSLLTLHNLIRARMVFLCHHLALFQVSLIDLKLKILNREVDSSRWHYNFQTRSEGASRQNIYRMRAIISRSWFETALDYKQRILCSHFLV